MRAILATLMALAAPFSASEAMETSFYGDATFRYEQDFDHKELDKRERIRFIGHLGIKSQLSDYFYADFRVRTGLRNKQNVPAITVLQFTHQDIPDRNIYHDRLYLGFKNNATHVVAGKIPWLLRRNTDLFWDRDLHPFGAYLNHQVTPNQSIDTAFIKPLDGDEDTIGTLSYLSFTQRAFYRGHTLSFTPWYVDYQGELGAEHALRDTEFDNRSLRFTTSIQRGAHKLGLDYGQAINDFNVDSRFSDQNEAWVAEYKFGQLKAVGNYEFHLRWLHVERFGAIAEFAQNASSRFTTTNYEGYELRLRKRVHKHWWVGTRFSDTRTLEQDETGFDEQGKRFRIEGHFSF